MFDFKKLLFMAALTSLMAFPALSSAPRAATDDDTVVKTVTVDQLNAMLKEMGIEATTDEEEPAPATLSWTDEERGTRFNLISYTGEEGGDTTDLMIQAVVTPPEGKEISLDAVNDWNVVSRFGRAYFTDGALYVEFDLRISNGVTKETIAEFLLGFQDTFGDAYEAIVKAEGAGG